MSLSRFHPTEIRAAQDALARYPDPDEHRTGSLMRRTEQAVDAMFDTTRDRVRQEVIHNAHSEWKKSLLTLIEMKLCEMPSFSGPDERENLETARADMMARYTELAAVVSHRDMPAPAVWRDCLSDLLNDMETGVRHAADISARRVERLREGAIRHKGDSGHTR